MNTYTVHFDATLTVEVEAEGEEQAFRLASSIAEQSEEDFNHKWAGDDAILSITTWKNYTLVLPDGSGVLH